MPPPIVMPKAAAVASDMAEGIPVPLSALAQPDDKEQMQTPGEGDSVRLQVDATVVSVQGDMAYIKPNAVNGQPLDEEEETESPEEEGQEMANPDEAESSLRDAMSQSNGQTS